MRVRLATARNLLILYLMLVIFATPAVLVGAAVRGWYGASFFFFAASLTALALYAHCDRLVLAMLGAKELVAGEQPVLHSSVARLAAKAGVDMPRLFFIPDGYPRSLSVGRGSSSSTLVFSLGLLTAASRTELEGLIAHELAHIRNRDVAVQTVSVAIAAILVESARLGGLLQRVFLFVLAPIAAGIVNFALSPGRELAADEAAATLCDTPHGLADALVRIDQASELVTFTANPTTEPLYPINPFAKDNRLARMFDTHPPFPERLRRLRELDPDWREKLRVP